MFNVYFDPERNQISASVALIDNFPVAIEAAKKSQEQADVSGETARAPMGWERGGISNPRLVCRFENTSALLQ